MAQQEDDSRKKQPPAPVRAAQEALVILRRENILGIDAISKTLPAVAMTLDRGGEEVTPEILLSHARRGPEHLKTLQVNAGQRVLDYDGIIRSFGAKSQRPYPTIPEKYFSEAIFRNDLPALKKFLLTHPNISKNRAQLSAGSHMAAAYGHLGMLIFFEEKYSACVFPREDVFKDSCRRGQIDIVKFLFKKYESDVIRYRGDALRIACECGHLEVVKFLAGKCDADDLNGQNGMAMRVASNGGHLGVVKYLVEKCGVRVNADTLNCAINGGSLEVVKYLTEKCKIDVHQKDDVFLYSAIRSGQVDIVRYFVEKHGFKIKEYCPEFQMPLQCQALALGQVPMAKYLVEEYGLSYELLKTIPSHYAKYKKFTAACKSWQRAVHIDPPQGCEDKSPLHFHPAAFKVANDALKKEDYAFNSEGMAYATSALFGTEQRLLQYIEKWGAGTVAPMHDLVQAIAIPKKNVGDLKSWADAVIKCGPSMAKLVKFCDRLKVPEKSADGKTWSMQRTREKVAQFAYKNAAQNPELAILCTEHAVDEADFNKMLKVVEKRALTKNIPDISIDGARFDMDNAVFYRLPASDVRAVLMGELTDCCQSVGGHGHDCAVHSVTSEDGGVYVIETKQSKLVLGEAWAWRGQKGEMCLDTLETLGQAVNEGQWGKLLRELSKELTERKDHDVTALTVGTGGDTPENLATAFKVVAGKDAAKPRGDYDKKRKYRESQTQLVVWKK